MKTIITCVMVFALIFGFAGEAAAQDPKAMLAELAEGIKPEAFKGKWAAQSADWKQNLANLDPTDTDGLMGSLKDLTKSLKGKAFEKGALKSLLASFGGDGAANIGQSIASLVSGLKPDMLTDNLREKLGKLMEGVPGAGSGM